MILNKDTAKKTAEFLLQIKAIKLQPNNPFTWASGWKSPIYCDNRITLSHHATRTYIREQLAHAVTDSFGKPDVIAGVATGAIPHGVLVAQKLGLPFVYVRPEPKTHGRKNQIEGYLENGQNVVVIEDLISTGNSSVNVVKCLQNNRSNVDLRFELDIKIRSNDSIEAIQVNAGGSSRIIFRKGSSLDSDRLISITAGGEMMKV